MEQDIIIKFCVVGQPGVGKTSMLFQYVHKKFDEKVRPTIGCDFSTKVKSNLDGKPIRLQLWDIAGQERFNAVSKMYLRGALGCAIVCSAIDKNSIDETLKWKKIIEDNSDFGPQAMIPCILVMNKSDLISAQSPEDYQKKGFMEDFCKTHGFCGFLLSSAKENKNIDDIFQGLLNETIARGLVKANTTPARSSVKKSEVKNDTIRLNNKDTTQSHSNPAVGKKRCCG